MKTVTIYTDGEICFANSGNVLTRSPLARQPLGDNIVRVRILLLTLEKEKAPTFVGAFGSGRRIRRRWPAFYLVLSDPRKSRKALKNQHFLRIPNFHKFITCYRMLTGFTVVGVLVGVSTVLSDN